MSTKSLNISKNTLAILKNFADLNSNILIKPGNVIRTVNVARTAMAEAKVPEQFEQEFGIWNLDQFLGVISLCSNPTFYFEEKKVNIKSSTGGNFEYFYAEPRLLTVPTKEPWMPRITATARIDESVFSEINRVASVLKVDDVSFISSEDGIMAIVTDLNDPTSHQYSIDLGGDNNGHTFEVNLKISNIQILNGGYKISFSENRMMILENEITDLTYWFGAESTSTYEEQ